MRSSPLPAAVSTMTPGTGATPRAAPSTTSTISSGPVGGRTDPAGSPSAAR